MIVLLLLLLAQICLVGAGMAVEYGIIARIKARGTRLLFEISFLALCAAVVIVEILKLISQYDGGTIQISTALFCGIYVGTGALAGGTLKQKYSRACRMESGPKSRLRACLAGLMWTVGFYAAFAVWRYASILGMFPFAVLLGAVVELILPSNQAEDLLAAACTACISTALGWAPPYFKTFLSKLYAGFHVTESGFAGLFTIVAYITVTLACLLIFEGLIHALRRVENRRSRETEKEAK